MAGRVNASLAIKAVRCVAVPMDFCTSMTPSVAAGGKESGDVNMCVRVLGPVNAPWMFLSAEDPT